MATEEGMSVYDRFYGSLSSYKVQRSALRHQEDHTVAVTGQRDGMGELLVRCRSRRLRPGC